MASKNDKSKLDRLLPKVVCMGKELTAKSHTKEVLDIPPKCHNSLTKAAEDGNMRIMRHLLAKGVDVNTTSPQDNTTALHFTAWLGHLASCTLLLAYKANPNAFDMHMRTPLHLAVFKQHYKVVSLLIDNGADCSLKGAGGLNAQQIVNHYNITCCRHLMKSNLTLPALTQATKEHLKKQDPYQRIMLWLDDLELNQLYPIAVPKDSLLLDIDDECKASVLPPLKPSSHKQNEVDIVPCHKLSQVDITHKESLGDFVSIKELKLTLPETPNS